MDRIYFHPEKLEHFCALHFIGKLPCVYVFMYENCNYWTKGPSPSKPVAFDGSKAFIWPFDIYDCTCSDVINVILK